MIPEDLRRRADRAFRVLLETPHDARARVLERESGGDAQLRALLEELLSNVDIETARLDPEGALQSVLRSSVLVATPTAPPVTGLRLGPYTLVRKLGEGGMGEVWEAEQNEPVRRSVALKLLKAAAHTKEVLARFEAERQTLAMMDHSGIARIFDAGTAQDGRSFLVMELVRGAPVTTYCDDHHLSLSERLGIFSSICAAVQHAHRRGVIHRDLKPSNVLVVDEGGVASPKVIDFGVAKAIEGSLGDDTVTVVGQLVGTPAYMSPEQTLPSTEGIDTRTDVYGLGAVLYELLSGSRPLQGLAGLSIDDVLRKIRHEEPALPSVVASAGGRALRGDLDWITLKALEKDRDRRYESPAELARDVERHLHGQPVVAGPPTAAYRIGKFVRRHAVAVAATGVFALFLTGFAVVTAVQSRRVARERDRANQEVAITQQVSDFLVNLFRVPDPEAGRGATVTALELLDEGSTRIDVELREQPVVQWRLMKTMGDAYRNLGEFERSEALLQQAWDTASESSDDDDPDYQDVAVSVAATQWRLGREERAVEWFERSLAMMRASPNPDPLRQAQTLSSTGDRVWQGGDPERGQAMLESSIQLQETVNPRHPELPRALNNLAIIHWSAGEYGKALPLLERALSIWEETLPSDHPNIASTVSNLAILYQESGDAEAALRYDRRGLAAREAKLGPDHPDVAESLNNLGTTLNDLGRHDEAIEHLQRALVIRRESLGNEHAYTATTLLNLGESYMRAKRAEAARPCFEESLAAFEASQGLNDGYTAYPVFSLGKWHAEHGNETDARRHFQRALAISQGSAGPVHPDVVEVVERYAAFERGLGHEAEADSLLASVSAVSPP